MPLAARVFIGPADKLLTLILSPPKSAARYLTED